MLPIYIPQKLEENNLAMPHYPLTPFSCLEVHNIEMLALNLLKTVIHQLMSSEIDSVSRLSMYLILHSDSPSVYKEQDHKN